MDFSFSTEVINELKKIKFNKHTYENMSMNYYNWYSLFLVGRGAKFQKSK